MAGNKFTTSYLRFQRQLTALQRGKLNLVKKLAREARGELAANTPLYQLKLGYSL